MSTNREEIAKGFRYCMACLPFMFLGPFILHKGFEWRNYLTIGVGIVFMFLAIFILFKGLKKITDTLFGN